MWFKNHIVVIVYIIVIIKSLNHVIIKSLSILLWLLNLYYYDF